MYKFWSKYHLPIGNSNLPKNHFETSYLLNKLDVLFEMPVYDTIAPRLAVKPESGHTFAQKGVYNIIVKWRCSVYVAV